MDFSSITICWRYAPYFSGKFFEKTSQVPKNPADSLLMGLALSGLASGFDWKSIVDQLIEVSRAPQNRMRTEKSQLSSKSSALNDIKGLVSSFKSSLTTLNSAEGFQKKSVSTDGNFCVDGADAQY